MSERIPPELVEYGELVEQIAVPMGLNASLVMAQIWTEVEQFLSDDDPDNQNEASREERRWRYFVDPRGVPLYNRALSVDENIRCAENVLGPDEFWFQRHSWGPMQIMGAVAREYGFEYGPEELCDPGVNITIGCQHLEKCLQRAGSDVRGALIRYNGSPAYAAKVMRRWEILKAMEI